MGLKAHWPFNICGRKHTRYGWLVWNTCFEVNSEPRSRDKAGHKAEYACSPICSELGWIGKHSLRKDLVPSSRDDIEEPSSLMENHGSFITWSARKDELRDLRDAPSTYVELEIGYDGWYSHLLNRRFGSISRFSPWFPEADPHNGRALSWLRRLTDRDIALVLILLLSSTILVLNLTLTIFSLAKYGYHEHISDILGPHSGGTCDKVKTYNTWLHFGINALSTLLLGASNYCAQLLVAPTRAEVDVAHSHQRWLDIGIQSFRNLRRVGWKRRAVWYTLMLSSGFLHLL